MRWRHALAAALAAALCAATPLPASAQPAPARIVAVGDLHGDYGAWTDIARNAELVDASGRWTGGSTVLVQLGDIADRGPDTLRIIDSLRRLQREAPRAGGRVVVLNGNHEAMNVTGDLRYVSAGEYAAFQTPRSAAARLRYYEQNKARLEAAAQKAEPSISPAAVREAFLKQTPLGWVEHRQAWSPAGRIGRWVIANPAVAKIGDSLFVHGGISQETAALPIDEINRQVAAALSAADDRPEAIINAPLGPLWYRGLVMRDPDANAARAAARRPVPRTRDELAKVLSAYRVKRIVVGHTPSLRGIVIAEGGWLARVDTGNSAHYGGQLAWLEILGDKVIPHNVQRTVR